MPGARVSHFDALSAKTPGPAVLGLAPATRCKGFGATSGGWRPTQRRAVAANATSVGTDRRNVGADGPNVGADGPGRSNVGADGQVGTVRDRSWLRGRRVCL
jgi:hypothetical protein